MLNQETKEKKEIQTKEILGRIIKMFESGNVPKMIARATFIENIPSSNWSLLNRMLMLSNGTQDARGFQQWKEVNRFVKKGAKSFRILAPRMVKIKGQMATEVAAQEDSYKLLGFLTIPVFRMEDTEGEEVQYEGKLKALPFLEKAKEWGITVKAVPFHSIYYGAYNPSENEIKLATNDESVFFHELAHAAHNRIEKLVLGQNSRQEIIAEFSAAALAQMVGLKIENLGNSFEYIKRYSAEIGLAPEKACMKVVSDVEKIIKMIID